MAVFIRRTTWVDVSGRSRTTQLLSNATSLLIQGALVAASNGDFALESEAPLVANIAPTPINAPYLSVIDQANLIFATATGGTVSVTLPAPRSSIFLADQESVDLTNVDIVNIATACIGTLTDASGVVVTSLVGGYRTANLAQTF